MLGLLLALAAAGEPVRVARLELPNPGHSPFVLHGTLPLPRGTQLGPAGQSTLWIESHDAARTLVPAQMEIVSRASDGQPDVVELIARVELDAAEREGGRSSYWVLQSAPAEPAGFQALPQVGALLEPKSHNLQLRTQDLYGNVYVADLCGDPADAGFGSLRVAKDGRWERELRLSAVLAPVGPPAAEGAPLPHLMGVHAYLRARAGDPVVSLDLRVHNGLVSGSRAPTQLEEPVGAVYWRSLELLIPREWNAVPEVADPFYGEPRAEGRWRVLQLVKPLAEGKLHLLPAQAQFERRLALIPAGQGALAHDELALDGLSFAQRGPKLWSWFEPECARWMAQRAQLPDFSFYKRGAESGAVALRSMESARMKEYAEALASGKPKGWYTIASVMGWCHPWFVSQAGGFGGEGLSIHEGAYTAFSASREGYRHLELLHRMNVCRQSEAAWTASGDPAGYHAWLDAEGKIPFDFRQGGNMHPPCFVLPCRYGPPPNAQVLEVVRRGLRPPYDMGDWFVKNGNYPDRNDNLVAWWAHDDQHMLRYTKNEKALVWLGNDSMAKDDLLLSGELFHLVFHESPHAEATWSKGVTLRVVEAVVRAHPHQGALLGRDIAWGVDAACAAYSIAPPEWRARNRDWLGHVAQLLTDAALPTGIIQRSVNTRVLGNERFTVTQTFESEFLIHALRCLDESVLRGVDPARSAAVEELALRAIDFLFWGPVFQRIQADWQPDPKHPTVYVQGPRWGFAISNNDDYATPPFADANKWGPNYLPPDGLGGGVELTYGLYLLDWARTLSEGKAGSGLENKYLKRALEYGVPHKDFASLAHDLEAQTRGFSEDNSASWAPFLATLQTLGVR
jgi:hypothetical protein